MTRVSALAIGAAFLLLRAGSTAAQTASRAPTFEPAVLHAGIPETARITVVAAGQALSAFRLERGKNLGDVDPSPELEIDSVSLRKEGGGWIYTAVFTVWAPGPGHFPSLAIQGFRFPAFDFEVAATADPEARSPGPRRPQADPPGSSVYLYASVGILVALVLAGIAFFSWILPGALDLAAAWRERAAFRRFAKTLDWLEESVDEGDGRAWYALLANSFRIYLSAKTIPAAMALTPPEIAALPAETLTDGFGGEAAELLARGDEVRFGGLATAASRRAEDARRARELAARVERSTASPGGQDVRN